MGRVEVEKPVKRPEEGMVAPQGEEIPGSSGCTGGLVKCMENSEAWNGGLVGTVC